MGSLASVIAVPNPPTPGKVLSRKRTNMYFKMATFIGAEASAILPAGFLVVYSGLVTSSLELLKT